MSADQGRHQEEREPGALPEPFDPIPPPPSPMPRPSPSPIRTGHDDGADRTLGMKGEDPFDPSFDDPDG